jgi:hypothetical protein
MKYDEAKALLRDGKCRRIRRAAWKAIDPDACVIWAMDDQTEREYPTVGCFSPELGHHPLSGIHGKWIFEPTTGKPNDQARLVTRHLDR